VLFNRATWADFTPSIRFVAAALIIALAWVSPLQANTQNQSIKAWLDGYVMPSYQHLHQANLALQQQASGLCNGVSAASLDHLQGALIKALNALAYSQAIDGGPMQGQLRNYRLYFWPDRKNLVDRQLKQLLAEPDQSFLLDHGLAAASVALTGYPALERLVFDHHFRQLVLKDKDQYACAYITAVADNLVTITAEIIHGWETQWYPQFTTPSNAQSQIKNQSEQMSFVFTNVDGLLSKIITKKLIKPLGSSAKHAKAKRMESWRSGQTANMLQANINGLEKTLMLVLKPTLIKAKQHRQWQTISHQLTLIKQQVKRLPRPYINHLNTPEHWSNTQTLQQLLEQLQDQLQGIYPLLNVQLGFNAYDGD